MGMNLNPSQLIEVAGKVAELENLGSLVDIKQISMHGHNIFLMKNVDTYQVIGISREKEVTVTSNGVITRGGR